MGRRLAVIVLTLLLLLVSAKAQAQSEAAIVPPRLEHFVEAEYPAEARKKGIEATVVLRLELDAEGKVTEAAVERGAGSGFDEAALRVARQFEFEPARKDGEAVAAAILFEYRFTLEPAKKSKRSTKADTEWARAVIVIVSEAGPIAGATVVLRDPEGASRTAQANDSGEARFTDLAAGTYRIEVAAPGYRSFAHDESVMAGRETRVEYTLAPAGGAIEVVVRGEVPRDVTVREISQEELKLVPGGAGDPVRVVESLPGVARSSDGSLVIRGASPFYSGVMIDGVAVPMLYHLYMVQSVVPADMVDTVKLYPGNYGVRHGRYIGGMVEVGLQSPEIRCFERGEPTGRSGCYHGMADLNLIDGRVQLEGPVPGAKRWSFGLSLRRSWLDVLLKEIANRYRLTLEVAPRYHDDYGLVEYHGKDEKLSLRVYGSKDEVIAIDDELSTDAAEVGRFQLEYGFERLQAVYEKKIDDHAELHSMLAFGRDNLALIADEERIVQRSWPIAFRHELRFRPHPLVDVNVGFDFLTAPYELRIRERSMGVLAPADDDTLRSVDATFGAYVETPIHPTPRATVIPGFRVDYTPLYEIASTDPRLTVRYDLVQRPTQKWGRRVTAKAGAGLYHQAMPIIYRFWDDDAMPRPERAQQYSVGLEEELSRHIDWSVEGFFINRDQLVTGDTEPDGTLRVENEGTGDTLGFESFLRYHSHDRFFGWVAYTLSRTLMRVPQEEERFPSDFDQTHNLIVVGSVDIGRGWRAGGRFRYVTGNPFTDIARLPRTPSLFDAQTGQYVAQYTSPNAERFPDVYQLDVRLDKRWQFGRWALTTYLDVRNATNHRVVDYFEYNYDFTQREEVQGLTVLPSLGVRGEF